MKSLLQPEVIEFIKGHLHNDPFSLSLAAKKYQLENLQEAILQIQARQKAFKKLPSLAENYELVFPVPLSVEQASSETTARFKSQLFRGETFVDLTGGMGIDALFFLDSFLVGTYVESDPELCQVARHNFRVLKKQIEVVNEKAEDFLSHFNRRVDLIYMDPSRRDEQRGKVFRMKDCFPNVVELENLLLEKADNLLIKLSPLADIKNVLSELDHAKKIWVVSIKNECKEILCWISRSGASQLNVEAVNFANGGVVEKFSYAVHEEDAAKAALGMPMKYLYEPNSSILKSGAFKLVGIKHGLAKLHPNTHLYTSGKKVEFPGRTFEIVEVVKADKKEMKRRFAGKSVHVISRNFPLKAEEVFNKFNLKMGEDYYLFATTLADNSKSILVCKRIR